MVSNDYTSKCSGPYWSNPPFLIFLTFGHSGAQSWAPECPNVEKLKKGGLEQYGAGCFGRLIFATSRKNVGLKGLMTTKWQAANSSRAYLRWCESVITRLAGVNNLIEHTVEQSQHHDNEVIRWRHDQHLAVVSDEVKTRLNEPLEQVSQHVTMLLSHCTWQLQYTTTRTSSDVASHLWNKLPSLLREPVSPLYAYLNPSFSSPLSPSITPSLFHSKLKTYLFGKSFPP